nr:STAS domain-containing protein [uncultured Streptomyces sp.]
MASCPANACGFARPSLREASRSSPRRAYLAHDSVPALEAAITASGRLPRVVVDFAHLTFIDSTGINTLLHAHRIFHGAGGRLRLSSIPDAPPRALRTVGLGHVIDVYDTLEAALRR